MTQALPHANLLAAPAGGVASLAAPARWERIDFISDLHLHESEPANFLAWRRYMESTPADAVFILGDLFEVWVGDDILRGQGAQFEARCANVLHHAAQHKSLYFMHGNRDFLLGSAALQTCGMQLLPDPTVLEFAGLRYLLSHGDALCLGDTAYQTFRAMVRTGKWQQDFLSYPLQVRLQKARELRAQSEARKLQGGPWVDLEPSATVQQMNAANALHMIHGHTHEGVDHPITSAQGTGVRHVLCDWHADAQPAREQVLRLAHGTAQRLPLDAAIAP
jgi:UDP-2,3-diacylglucosamine hydrolase